MKGFSLRSKGVTFASPLLADVAGGAEINTFGTTIFAQKAFDHSSNQDECSRVHWLSS